MAAETLELDVGNTRIKWRFRARACDALAETPVAAVSSLDALFDALQGQAVARVCVASVRDASFEEQLCGRVRQELGLDTEVARVAASCCGVSNSYDDPSRMGVDRWLAMVAAYHRVQSACCVVDCGSALTMDCLDDRGRHLGGYIVPGLLMQRRAITGFTSIRLPDAPSWRGPVLGQDTSGAVEGGILAALISLVANDPVVRSASAADALFLTGGDAPLLSPWLRQRGLRWHNAPNLVLDGLGCVLP